MIDLSSLGDYLVLVVVFFCLCIGYIIKTSFDSIPNKYIPLVMATLGVLVNIWVAGRIDVEVLLGGMFSGLASTGLYEAFRNIINKKGE